MSRLTMAVRSASLREAAVLSVRSARRESVSNFGDKAEAESEAAVRRMQRSFFIVFGNVGDA